MRRQQDRRLRRLAEVEVLDQVPEDGDVLPDRRPGVGTTVGGRVEGASKIVAGLRQRGYVEVTPSPADGREKILTLTPRAVAFLAARREAARAIEARLRDEIGADGVTQLRRFLDAVAGEDAAAGDLPWDSPALRALRWWDAEDRP